MTGVKVVLAKNIIQKFVFHQNWLESQCPVFVDSEFDTSLKKWLPEIKVIQIMQLTDYYASPSYFSLIYILR
mgnify:CR=1 FL=1